MAWKKHGRVFVPNHEFDFMVSHASNPIAEHLRGDTFRIYFGSRDSKNRTHVAFVEIDLNAPEKILAISEKPALAPGDTGYFDDSGVSVGSITAAADGTLHFYYLGWNLGVTAPWRNFIGLAKRAPGATEFIKHDVVPIMDRSREDPFTVSYPWVLREGDQWRMWYCSTTSWERGKIDANHVLKYAESADGISWTRFGECKVLPTREDESVICRPTVLREGSTFKMWYGHRGAAYRIGYAESEDGRTWHHGDPSERLAPSDTGWDAEAVEYPCVFQHRGARFLLHNGSTYGKTGFGLAIWE